MILLKATAADGIWVPRPKAQPKNMCYTALKEWKSVLAQQVDTVYKSSSNNCWGTTRWMKFSTKSMWLRIHLFWDWFCKLQSLIWILYVTEATITEPGNKQWRSTCYTILHEYFNPSSSVFTLISIWFKQKRNNFVVTKSAS